MRESPDFIVVASATTALLFTLLLIIFGEASRHHFCLKDNHEVLCPMQGRTKQVRCKALTNAGRNEAGEMQSAIQCRMKQSR